MIFSPIRCFYLSLKGDSKLALLALLAFAFLATGCDQRPQNAEKFDRNKYPVANGHSESIDDISSFSSAEGTFLFGTHSGKAWKFVGTQNAFIRVALMSDLRIYNPNTKTIDAGVDPEKILKPTFQPFASHDGTFLLEGTTERVWRFDPSGELFREIPVTTEITKIDRDSNGDLKEVPEKNASGKPCDKKADPLCIR